MEGEAGCGDEGGFPVAGEAVDAGCLGGGQPDRGDAGRAGLAAAGGQRRGSDVDLQVSGIYGGLIRRARGVLARGRGGGEDVRAGEGGLEGGGPELGEGGPGGGSAGTPAGPWWRSGPSRRSGGLSSRSRRTAARTPRRRWPRQRG